MRQKDLNRASRILDDEEKKRPPMRLDPIQRLQRDQMQTVPLLEPPTPMPVANPYSSLGPQARSDLAPRLDLPKFKGVGPEIESFVESPFGAAVTGGTGGLNIPVLNLMSGIFGYDPEIATKATSKYRREHPFQSGSSEAFGALMPGSVPMRLYDKLTGITKPISQAVQGPTRARRLAAAGGEGAAYEVLTGDMPKEDFERGIKYGVGFGMLGNAFEQLAKYSVEKGIKLSDYVMEQFRRTSDKDKAIAEIARSDNINLKKVLNLREDATEEQIFNRLNVLDEEETLLDVGSDLTRATARPPVVMARTLQRDPEVDPTILDEAGVLKPEPPMQTPSRVGIDADQPRILAASRENVSSTPVKSQRAINTAAKRSVQDNYLPLYEANPIVRSARTNDWFKNIAKGGKDIREKYSPIYRDVINDFREIVNQAKIKRVGDVGYDIAQREIALYEKIIKRADAGFNPFELKTGNNQISLAEWDGIQQHLNEMSLRAKGPAQYGVPTPTQESTRIMGNAKIITNELDNKLPGYKELRNSYRQTKDSEEMLRLGQEIFSPKTRLDDIDEIVQRNIEDNPAAMDSFLSGINDAIQQSMGTGSNIKQSVQTLTNKSNEVYQVLEKYLPAEQFDNFMNTLKKVQTFGGVAKALKPPGTPPARGLVTRTKDSISEMGKGLGFLVFGRGDMTAAMTMKEFANIISQRGLSPATKNHMLEFLATPINRATPEATQAKRALAEHLAKRNLNLTEFMESLGFQPGQFTKTALITTQAGDQRQREREEQRRLQRYQPPVTRSNIGGSVDILDTPSRIPMR